MLARFLFRVLMPLGLFLCLGLARAEAQQVGQTRSFDRVGRLREDRPPIQPQGEPLPAVPRYPIRELVGGGPLARRPAGVNARLGAQSVGPLEAVLLVERSARAVSGCLCFRLHAF